MIELRWLLPDLRRAVLLIERWFMCIHLRLEDPGTDGAVLAVHVGLPHLVEGHLHVGLALLRNLPPTFKFESS